MPDVSFSIVITIIAAIFSAGITWGVMSAKQKRHGSQIEDIVKELKEVVMELRRLTSELHVMQVSNIRNEQDIQKHEKRIQDLELAFAKLHAQLQ